MIVQGNAFAREAQKFDVEIDSTPFSLGEANHARVWFERVEPVHFRTIIVRKIDAWAHTDLEDHSLSLWNDLPPHFTDRIRITEDSYQVCIDMIPVKAHNGQYKTELYGFGKRSR